jgi:hypothetical protein
VDVASYGLDTSSGGTSLYVMGRRRLREREERIVHKGQKECRMGRWRRIYILAMIKWYRNAKKEKAKQEEEESLVQARQPDKRRRIEGTATGATGTATGATGARGARGAREARGARGARGATGATGATGVAPVPSTKKPRKNKLTYDFNLLEHHSGFQKFLNLSAIDKGKQVPQVLVKFSSFNIS